MSLNIDFPTKITDDLGVFVVVVCLFVGSFKY